MSGWKTVKLADCAGKSGLFSDGDWVESKDQDPDGDVRLIQMADIGDGFYKDRSARFLTSDKFAALKCTEVVKGDLLISRMPDPIGRCCVFPGDSKKCATVVDIAILRPDPSICMAEWLKYRVNTPLVRAAIEKKTTGATRKRISGKNLKNIEIPLPPLEEQERIVAVLDKAQELIDKRVEQICLLDTLIQSVFYDMFGDPVTNPKGWETASLDNLIDLLTGYPFKSDCYSSNDTHIKICGGLIIMPWGIDWSSAKYWDISTGPDVTKFFLEENDIVIAMDRPWINSGFKIALIKCYELPALLVQRTARLRCCGANHHYIFSALKDKAFERHATPTETTVPHISPKDIRTYTIPVPPIDLQNEFAARVEAIEAQKKKMEESLQQLRDNFNSLMQRAFKGEL